MSRVDPDSEAPVCRIGYNEDAKAHGGGLNHGRHHLDLFDFHGRFHRPRCVGGRHTSQRPMGDKSGAGALPKLRHAGVGSPATTLRVAKAIGGMDVPPLRNEDG